MGHQDTSRKFMCKEQSKVLSLCGIWGILTQDRPVRMESFHWNVPKPMASTASSTMNVSKGKRTTIILRDRWEVSLQPAVVGSYLPYCTISWIGKLSWHRRSFCKGHRLQIILCRPDLLSSVLNILLWASALTCVTEADNAAKIGWIKETKQKCLSIHF